MPEKETLEGRMRSEYQRRMLAIRDAFEAGATGAATIAARAQAMDELVVGLWTRAVEKAPVLRSGIALVGLGGYGRSELFPYSDVDLMYLLDGKVSEKDVKQPIRRISQELWDSGIRLSPLTRKRSGSTRTMWSSPCRRWTTGCWRETSRCTSGLPARAWRRRWSGRARPSWRGWSN
jgi:UTP:GlnB (protein PII) uridylyltransferase